jgi:hypothetical protein
LMRMRPAPPPACALMVLGESVPATVAAALPLPQEERQNTLWDALRERMKPDELVDIVALMTMTPEEVAA